MKAGQSGRMMDGKVSQKFAFDDLDDRDEARDVCRGISGGSFLAWFLCGGGGGRFAVGGLGVVVWFGPLFLSVWGK